MLKIGHTITRARDGALVTVLTTQNGSFTVTTTDTESVVKDADGVIVDTVRVDPASKNDRHWEVVAAQEPGPFCINCGAECAIAFEARCRRCSEEV